MSSYKSIQLELETLLSRVVGINYRYSRISGYEASEKNINNAFYDGLIGVGIEIGQMNQTVFLNNGGYNINRQLIISTLIDSFLLEYLKIDEQDCLKLLFYLSSRYVLNRHERNVNHPAAIATVKKEKLKRFHRHFEENKEHMIQATEQGISIANNPTMMDGKIYQKVILKIKDFLDCQPTDIEELISENILTVKALEPDIRSTQTIAYVRFILIFQHLQPILLLNSDQAALCLSIPAESRLVINAKKTR